MPIDRRDAYLLRQPFGTLIPDNQVAKHNITSMLRDARHVITVGDATTDRLLAFGITPDVAVIDGKERRSMRSYSMNYAAKELHCANPAGSISRGAVMIVQEALKTPPPVRIVIDGEEDLLALPLFAMSPVGSFVLYGQPLEGMVLVEITAAKQKEAKELMERICDNTNLITGVDGNNNERKNVPQGKARKKGIAGPSARRTAKKNKQQHDTK